MAPGVLELSFVVAVLLLAGAAMTVVYPLLQEASSNHGPEMQLNIHGPPSPLARHLTSWEWLLIEPPCYGRQDPQEYQGAATRVPLE